MSSVKKATRSDQSEQTRRAILEAALRQFSEHGFDGVSVRMIADEVGVNHAMIRYYFGSKNHLWEAAFKFLSDRFDKELQMDFPPEFNTLDRAKMFVRRYVVYCARYPEHARIMIQENMRPTDRLALTVPMIRAQHARAIPVLESWIQDGLVPKMPVVSLIYALVGMCQLPFVLANEIKQTHELDYRSQELIDLHSDAVIALLFRDQ